MADVEEIERKAKQHQEIRELSEAEARDELAAKRKVMDSKGKQLRFEGVDIIALKSQFKGTVKLELGHLEAGTIVRFEGTAVVNEINLRNRDGWTRHQVLSAQTLEVLPVSPAGPEHISTVNEIRP